MSGRRIATAIVVLALAVGAWWSMTPRAPIASSADPSLVAASASQSATTDPHTAGTQTTRDTGSAAASTVDMEFVLANKGPFAHLFEPRLACARAGDADCIGDIWRILAVCEFNYQSAGDDSPEGLQRAIAPLQRGNVVASYVERTRQVHAECAKIGQARIVATGTSSEWKLRAFDAGHPQALIEAARAISFVAEIIPLEKRSRFVLSREEYGKEQRDFHLTRDFLVSDALDDQSLKQRSAELWNAAIATGRAEVLMSAAFRGSYQRDHRTSDAEDMVVTGAWATLACARGYPCGPDSTLAEAFCANSRCPPDADAAQALASAQGPGFPALVTGCAARLDALLAAGEIPAALALDCR